MPEVLTLTERDQIADAVAFRESVLVEVEGLLPFILDDDFDSDPSTVHCVVRGADGDCIGYGRLVAPIDREVVGEVIEGNPCIGPIVVAPHARGLRIGRAVLFHLENEALVRYGSNGVVRIEARIPPGAEGQAASFGYEIDPEAGEPDTGAERAYRDVTLAGVGDARSGPAAT